MTKILIIIDMQNDFTTGPLGNAGCAAAVPAVVSLIEGGGYDRILATRDTHGENYMDTLEGKNLPVIHCVKGTPGWEIVPEIKAAMQKACPDAPVFDKPAFGSVRLGEYLGALYARDPEMEIDFAGVCTGICVIGNVALAKAFCPEARVRVLSSACACVTPDTHRTALEAMKVFQVEVV